MNIKEVEAQLGLPRSNIRYYEKEGLLHPSRSGNNYRIYTPEDVETLRKIRLLRQLDMPVEIIRAVQSGEVPLYDALSRQLRLLEDSTVRLEQAQAVCRAMLDDRAEYPALQPARYEHPAALPDRTPHKSCEEPEMPPVEGAVWAFNPWQRFWARYLDHALLSLAVTALLALVFHRSPVTGNTAGLYLADMALTILLWFLLEPLLLCTWGTTPGKWLLGLELRSSSGGKLRYSQAFERVRGVWKVGFGFFLPIYRIYRFYQCWKLCREETALSYDWEEGTLYYSLPGDRWQKRAVLSVLLAMLLAAAAVWMSCQAILPPNRGDVTAEEFFENINFHAGWMDCSSRFDSEGYALAAQTMDVSTNGGPIVHYESGSRFEDTPVYQVETDENGFVTAVTLTREEHFSAGTATGPVWLPETEAELAVLALAGTRGSGWHLLRSRLLLSIYAARSWDGAAVSENGLSLTLALEQEGFLVGNHLLVPETEDGSCWYRVTVRLEKAS